MNLNSRTAIEQHEDNKNEFRELMPILRTLDEEESEIFFHLINNKGRSENPSTQNSNYLIDEACSNATKERLAKISEEANFAMKNTYKHQQDTMKYDDKKRMPIEHTKVRDILRNQHIARYRIDDEIGTYTQFKENP